MGYFGVGVCSESFRRSHSASEIDGGAADAAPVGDGAGGEPEREPSDDNLDDVTEGSTSHDSSVPMPDDNTDIVPRSLEAATRLKKYVQACLNCNSFLPTSKSYHV